MSNAKKPETTGQTTETGLYKPTSIIATLDGLDTNNNKDSENYGRTYYKYNLTGPKAEIEEFLNHPSNQEYGIKYARDGKTPQLWCYWSELFANKGDKFDVYVNYYGNYSLEKSASKLMEANFKQMEERGLNTLATVYAQTLIGNKLGLSLNQASVNRLAQIPSNGADANLDE